MEKKGVLLLLFVILLISNVYAFGASPGKTLVFFTGSSLQEDLHMSFKNNHDTQVVGEIYSVSNGFPEEYINLEPINLTFEPGEIKNIDFSIDIPQKFDEPGDYRFDVMARELFPAKEEGGLFTVSIATGGIFLVRVPREGYFLSATLTSKSSSAGENVPFVLTLENLGTLPIKSIEGNLQIYNASGDKIGDVPFTHSLPINSVQNVDLNWDSSGNSYGEYSAVVTLNFYGKSVEAKTTFKLGDVYINILDYDKSINAGKINKFKTKIKSEWGSSLENVYLSLEIYKDVVPLVYKSESFNLNSFETNDITIYVDAENIGKGIYPAKISAIYQGIYTEEEFDLKVGSSINLVYVGIGILALIIIILSYFFIFKRTNKKKRR